MYHSKFKMAQQINMITETIIISAEVVDN